MNFKEKLTKEISNSLKQDIVLRDTPSIEFGDYSLPCFNSNPEEFKNKIKSSLIEKIDSSSFPSMHAARATVLSLFAYFNLQFNLFIFILILSLIILYSRIYLKKHYFRDILAGILIGILSFYLSNNLLIS